MRIIHDIEGPVQVSGSGQHYAFRVDGETPPPYGGCRAEILITSRCSLTVTTEEVYLEGNAKYLRAALEGALRALDDIEQIAQDLYAKDVTAHWQAQHDHYVARRLKAAGS